MKNGGSFFAGWVGGEISGAATGFGLSSGATAIKEVLDATVTAGSGVVKSLGTIIGKAFVGGGAGGFFGSISTQVIDNKSLSNIDYQEALSNGVINGLSAALSSPFGFTSNAIREASKGISVIVSTIIEGVFDLSSATLSNGV